MFMIWKITAFELVSEVSVKYDKNTWDRPSSVKKRP